MNWGEFKAKVDEELKDKGGDSVVVDYIDISSTYYDLVVDDLCVRVTKEWGMEIT